MSQSLNPGAKPSGWNLDSLFYQRPELAQTVKRLSAMQETRVRSLGWEDPLEKEMVAHPSVLAWKIQWTAEPGRVLSVHEVAKSWTALSNFPSSELQ